MILFEYPELALTQFAFLVLSLLWLLKRNDEIPLLISSFLFYVASYRYWAVESGMDRWTDLTWLGFSSITTEAALNALTYIVLGQICLLVSYMLTQRKVLPVARRIGEASFLNWFRPKTILFGLFCLPLVIVSRSQVIAAVNAGSSLAFQVNKYLYFFPLALIGIATLTACLWRFGGFSTLFNRVAAAFIFISVFYLTFGSQGRFQFMGWITAAGVIFSSFHRPKVRLFIITGLLTLAIALFAMGGAMRNPNLASESLNQAALERALSAEDANMLDGFVLLQTVYPERLDFQWGMEHLEILLRPIPRSWWPGKPLGGYMNRLGLTIAGGKGTLGISPSLFGSFYAEGGILGILFFAPLYGVIIGKVVQYSVQLKPFASILVRAILCASLLPLLRGGDLPGIYAWLGMAFWPCFLVLWLKRSDLRLNLPVAFPYTYHQIPSSANNPRN